MRKVLWLPIVAALLWSGYWAVGFMGLTRGFDHWLELRRGEGWQAEAARIETTGFPAKFVTRVEGLDLVDPETGLGWQVPEFHFEAAAHAPTYVEATWPETQTIITPFETIAVAAEEMQAGLGLVPGPWLALDTSDVILQGVALQSSEGWSAALDAGTVTTRRLEDPLAHDIGFTATNLRPSAQVLEFLDPRGTLPREILTLELDMRAAFDVPWDRRAIEERRPQPTHLEIRKMTAQWGQMRLEVAGEVRVDPDGVPDGKITIRAVNWRDMLELAETGGLVPRDVLPLLTRGLELAAGLSGNPRTIDAPLSLGGGTVSIGPFPIGPSPILRLR